MEVQWSVLHITVESVAPEAVDFTWKVQASLPRL